MSAHGPLRHLVRRSHPVAYGGEADSQSIAGFGRATFTVAHRRQIEVSHS